jgi:hypothetical protein
VGGRGRWRRGASGGRQSAFGVPAASHGVEDALGAVYRGGGWPTAALIKKGCCGRAGDRWWGKRGNPCGLRRHGTNSEVKKDEDASTHLLGLVEDKRKQSSYLRQVQEVDNNDVGRVFAREKKRKKPMTPWSVLIAEEKLGVARGGL